jgi:hypothetical protein
MLFDLAAVAIAQLARRPSLSLVAEVGAIEGAV